ncbi:MAG: MerR family transcriptional regulator [Blastochloris sp.]|nr:MerR family transcriptional regulator [Blastochloris sp.]
MRVDLTHAEAAVEFLERWAYGQVVDMTPRRLTIGQTAQHLRVTTDQLRNWDRNGLLNVPRDPETGYRMYSAQEIGRLRVIHCCDNPVTARWQFCGYCANLDAGRTGKPARSTRHTRHKRRYRDAGRPLVNHAPTTRTARAGRHPTTGGNCHTSRSPTALKHSISSPTLYDGNAT